MKFLTEYRNAAAVSQLVQQIRHQVTRPWAIMEVCGGQTHTIIKSGIDELLPSEITLIHGPGCPVCVTPMEMLDRAIEIATRKNVILATFGDMIRVPGSSMSLLGARTIGADVRTVYSPMDAIQLAVRNADREIVFFGVGFETTAPGNAQAIWYADQLGLSNFSMLCSHVRVPPAIEAILNSPDNSVQAFLAAGHVCTIMGYSEYEPIAAKYRVPIVVTGFEPVDILEGIWMAVQRLEAGIHGVANQYARSVTKSGNPHAQRILDKVFEFADQNWRGFGNISDSGLVIRSKFQSYDAAVRYAVNFAPAVESELCIAGEILRGVQKPHHCKAFGKECTPDHPIGAPMVSSEGACAAYFHCGRFA